MGTKDKFHKLIDVIEDEKLLAAYYELIQRLNLQETGKLWEGLSEEEKEELMLSYDESFKPDNILTHDEVKNQHDRWLKK